MRKLRRASTRKLMALCLAIVGVLAVGVAIANAIGTSGSPPPPKPLPQAVHGALTAPSPVGITARISYTSRLVNSSLMTEHTSPLLKGGSGRLWVAQGGKLRIELQSDRGDSQVISDGHRFLLTDPSSHTVYTGAIPQHRERRAHGEHAPSLAEITKGLGRLERFAHVLGPGRGVVAGRPAYSVRVEPRNNKGLFGGVGGAWDAVRGVPLRLSVYAKGVSAPVIELHATNISYGPVPASTFNVSIPKNSRVHTLATGRGNRGLHRSGNRHEQKAQGLAAVSKALSFKLVAPDQLAGEPRTEAHLIDSHGSPAAVVAYGKPLLGGLVVIERKVGKSKAGADRSGTSNLPHVKIGGVDATELSTPLGTLVSFERGGVSYTVIGSVAKSKAEAAAQGL